MEKLSKCDIAYNYVKDGIIKKKFFPGNRIIEDEIVSDTGVSRTSVRKALTRLQCEGILQSTMTRGMIVKKHSVTDIMDIFQIREVLEINAFRLAINNITAEAIERMKEQNHLLELCSQNFSISNYVVHNKKFHWEIAEASGNSYYKKFLEEIYNSLSVCLLFYNDSVDDVRSLMYHSEIIEALESKDLERGEKAIINDNRCGIEDQNLNAVLMRRTNNVKATD